MKAVVLSVKNNKAAVAFHDGTLEYIDDKGYVQGQILDIPCREEVSFTVHEGGKKKFSALSRYASSVAAAASVLLLTGAVTAYALPVSTVTIDVNPSLSLGINILDRVVRADYGNEDGKELLQDISPELIGKKLPDAVNIVFDGMEERDYINGEDIPAASTVTGIFPGRNRDRMMDELRSSAEHWNEVHKDRSVSFEVERMTPELRREAGERGMTPGQLMLERRKSETEIPLPEEAPQYEAPSAVPEYDPVEEKERDTENDSGKKQESPEDQGYSRVENPSEKPGNSGGEIPSEKPETGGGQAPPENRNDQGAFDPGTAAPSPESPDNSGFVPSPDNPDNSGFVPAPENPDNSGFVPAPENPDNSGFVPMPENPDNSGFAPSPDNTGNGGGEAPPENSDEGRGREPSDNPGKDGGEKEGGGHGGRDHGPGGGGNDPVRKK